MTSINEKECSICHKEFTSKRSLSIHIKTHNKENNCIYCNVDFASKQSLDRHIKTCLSKREDENRKLLEELDSFKKKDIEQQNIINKHEDENKKLKQELHSLRSETYKLNELTREQSLIIKHLESEKKELESNRIMLYNKLITIQENQNAKVNNINYNINNSMNNTNTTNQQQFNILSTTANNVKTLLSKIDLVNNKVTSEGQFAKLLEKIGINDFFRVTDTSRGIAEWVDENNNIQKDKYAEQLTNRFCDPEIAKKAKKKIEQQKKNTTDHEEIISHNKRINLCSRIGTKDKDTIKNIGKGLIKNGISKKSNKISNTEDEIKTKSFKEPHLYYSSRLKRIYPLLLNFILEKPERLLFSNPSNIGGWLGEFFTPYIISSVVIRETKKCYVELLDDENEICRLEDKDFVEVIRTCINGELINSESFGRIFIQGINNIVNDKDGFQSVVCSDEDPLDLLFINLRWLGNWFLNWTGSQEEEMYTSQTKEMFSMFITSVPERADWYHNGIEENESNDDDSDKEERNDKEDKIPLREQYCIEDQQQKEKRVREQKEREDKEREQKKEEYMNRQNAILKFRYQQQFNKKELEEDPIFDKRRALNRLKNQNKEDNLYDDVSD